MLRGQFHSSSPRDANMESSTWCTRRLGVSAPVSEHKSTFHATTDSRLSTRGDESLAKDCTRSFGAKKILRSSDISGDDVSTRSVTRRCHCSPGSIATEDSKPHGTSSSSVRSNQYDLCCLCERLRGPNCDYSMLEGNGRSMEEEPLEQASRRGGVLRRDADHAATFYRLSVRARFQRPVSSSSCAFNLQRWNSKLVNPLRWSRQRQTFAWTILFLLVLVFPTFADLQNGISRGSSKEEGGESIVSMHTW